MQAAAAQQKAQQQLREAQRMSRTSAQQQRDRAQSAQQEAEQLQRQLYLTRKVNSMISTTVTAASGIAVTVNISNSTLSAAHLNSDYDSVTCRWQQGMRLLCGS
jgi:sRNA-binding protein